tara:strand:- start:19 stop:1887 length:1869 start_codon:yes stop_codon:yes gene_type:complete
MALTQVSTQGIKDGTITGTDLATNVDLVDNQKLRLGTGNDLQIYHTGNHGFVQNSTGHLSISSGSQIQLKVNTNEDGIVIYPNGAVELYHDNIKKFETTSVGAKLTSSETTNGSIIFDVLNGLRGYVYADNANNIGFLDSDADWLVKGTKDAGVKLHFNGSEKFETTNSGVSITGGITANGTSEFTANVKFDGGTAGRDVTFLRSSNKLRFQDNTVFSLGDDDDFSSFHDGSKTRFINDTGNLELQSDNYIFRDKDNGDLMMKLLHDGAVELYYDHVKKLETTSLGVQLTDGHIFLNDNYYLSAGTGNDLQIYHDGNHSYVADNGAGELRLASFNGSGVRITKSDSETLANFTNDGAVELYFDNSKKLETTSTGINVPASVPTITLSDTDGNTPYSRITAGGGDLVFEADQGDEEGNTVMLFRVDDSEKMRIEASGAIRAGVTSAIQAEKYSWFRQESDANTLAYFHQGASADVTGIIMRHGRGLSGFAGKMIGFLRNDGTEVGSVAVGASSTAFNTSSDYRLKENVTAITDGITRLKTLKPYKFNFKDDTTKPVVDGFFAHEVTAVPEAITGTKDEVDADNNPVYQSIDQSKLVPLLVAAVQEAIGKIEVLETEVAALKAA